MLELSEAEQTLARIAIYAQKYRGKTIVIKIGGEVIDHSDSAILDRVVEEVVLLKALGAYVVISHGGGKQIDAELKKHYPDHQIIKKDGIRVADIETLNVSRDVAKSLSTMIAAKISEAGEKYGIRGFAADTTEIISAKQLFEGACTGTLDLNSEVKFFRKHIASMVDIEKLKALTTQDQIPVFAWHCASNQINGMSDDLTVNADEVACIIASALEAERLIYFSTDPKGLVQGVHRLPNSNEPIGELIKQLTISEAKDLIADGTAKDGMAIKLLTCLFALKADVQGVVICRPEKIVDELMTVEGAGTLIIEDPQYTP